MTMDGVNCDGCSLYRLMGLWSNRVFSPFFIFVSPSNVSSNIIHTLMTERLVEWSITDILYWIIMSTCKGLVTNYGQGAGGYKTGRGHVRFYSYEKGGRKGFSHAEGGRGEHVLGYFLCGSLKF